MTALYRASENAVLLASALAGLAAMAQLGLFLLHTQRFLHSTARRAQAAAEFFGFAQLFWAAWLIAQVQFSTESGDVSPYRLAALRWTLFAGACAAAACALKQEPRAARNRLHAREPLPLAAAVLSVPLLPGIDTLPGRSLVPVLCCTFLLWLVHAARGILSLLRERASSLSARSVKETVDALQTGLLFYAPDGCILLVNRRMQALLDALLGAGMRNGRQVWARLQAGDVRAAREHDLVYRLADGTVWQFAAVPLAMGRQRCTQLSAVDITAQWEATRTLERENALLRQRRETLRAELANAQELARTQVALQARTRLHDALGQRVTVLLQMLRQQVPPDPAVLRGFAAELPELLARQPETGAPQALEELRRMLAGIGAEFAFEGALPAEEQAAALCLRIFTEGAVNAVRHGFAVHVTGSCREEAAAWQVRVTDDGVPPQGPLHEGGGLTGMRRALAQAGGSLEVQTVPHFVLSAVIPKEGDSQ